MAVRRQGDPPAKVDARQRWRSLRWFMLPLPEMPTEARELAERYQTELRRVQVLNLTDAQRCDALLAVLDVLKPGLRDEAIRYLERSVRSW